VNHEVWTVLAPGPSLKGLVKSDIEAEGPIVACNTAALSPLPRDFWSCLDPPRKFEQVYGGFEPMERPILGLVWCRHRQVPKWRDLGFRTWSYPETEEDFRAAYLPRAKKLVTMTNLTITATISRCIGLGARRVILYGVDMGKVGYSYGGDPTNRPASAWPARWKEESKIFDLAMQEWRSLGVEIDRR